MESFKKVNYSDLSNVQKESYAFCKIQSAMAERGWLEFHRLNDDHNGADFVAFHIGGKTERFQQKARYTLSPKYFGLGIKVIVYDAKSQQVYMYDHDDAYEFWLNEAGRDFGDELRSRTIPHWANTQPL
jgi:hypothetical protein